MLRTRAGIALFTCGLMAALLLPAAAAAQDWRRSGFWLELGTGHAAIRVACATCTDVTRSNGNGSHLRLGGTISDKVLLGVEAFSVRNEGFGFGADDESLTAENGSFSAIVLWYPWRYRFFIKGGIGFAAGEFTVDAETEEPILSEGTGVGMTFGVGIDQPVWRGLAVTANAGVWVSAIGDVVLPATTVDDVIATIYNLSIGFTIR